MLPLLASATWLGVACNGGGSSSGGQGNGPDAAADVGMPDASPSEDAPTSDAPDAATCSGLGALGIGPLNLNFDQEVTYLCAESDAGAEVSVGTMECDGLLAVAEHQGADEMYFYLFDPKTRALVEALACINCDGFVQDSWCVTSATGIDLTKSPNFNGCWGGGLGSGGGGFGFQMVCPDGGPTGPSDSGPLEASSDAPFDAPLVDSSPE